MARRFGRNQKRKLRQAVTWAQGAAQAALDIAKVAQDGRDTACARADRAESDLRYIADHLEMLLGSNSVVFPPKVHEDSWDHDYPTIEHSLRLRPTAFGLGSGPPSVVNRAFVLMRKVEATLEVCEPHNDPRLAVHWISRSRLGHDRIGETRVETYWASDRALAQQSPEFIAKQFAENAVRFFRQHYTVDLKTGKIVRKEATKA